VADPALDLLGGRTVALTGAGLSEGEAETYAEGVDLLHLASEMVIDAVIQPEDLRAELVRRFARYAGKHRDWPRKRHGVTPV